MRIGLLIVIAFSVLSSLSAADSPYTVRELSAILDQLSPEEKYELLQVTLENESNKEVRAAAYYELSQMYQEIGDVLESEQYFDKALETDEDTLRKQYKETPWKFDRIYNKVRRELVRRSLTGSVALGFESNSNVTLEPLGTEYPSDESDYSFILNLGLAKQWQSATGSPWVNQTRYSYYSQDYKELETYSLSSHSIVHNIQYRASLASRALFLSIAPSFNKMYANDEELLESIIVTASGAMLVEEWASLFRVEGMVKHNNYQNSSELNGESFRVAGHGMRFFKTKWFKHVNQTIQYSEERTERIDSGYYQYEYQAGFAFRVESLHLDLMATGMYYKRDYKDYREDDHKNFRVQASHEFIPNLLPDSKIHLAFGLDDNSSTDERFRYEAQTVSLTVSHNF